MLEKETILMFEWLRNFPWSSINWATVGAVVGAAGSTIIATISLVKSSQKDKADYAKHFSERLEQWNKDTLQIMKDLFYMHSKKTTTKTQELLSKLSTQIDFGRTVFTNVRKEKSGQNKPELFRGTRVVPIELLVMYHHVFEEGSQNNHMLKLRNIERAWISEVSKYSQTMQKTGKITPYTLTDDAKLLRINNLNDPQLKEIFENQDLIEFVKLSNKLGSTYNYQIPTGEDKAVAMEVDKANNILVEFFKNKTNGVVKKEEVKPAPKPRKTKTPKPVVEETANTLSEQQVEEAFEKR